MATRVVQTRIQNKFDTLANWEYNNPILLAGEIAVVKTSSDQSSNSFKLENDTSATTPLYRIKIGDGITAFNELAWLHADTIGVHNWAKTDSAGNISVAITTEGGAGSEEKTLKEWLEFISRKQQEQDDSIESNTYKLDDLTCDLQTRVSSIEDNYIKFSNDRLFIGKTGADEVILSAGGVDDWMKSSN